MVQSKTVLSVSTELKVGNSGFENISIEFFGANVNEYFDHLIWHLADRKFNDKSGSFDQRMREWTFQSFIGDESSTNLGGQSPR